jgi:hypothetical protein
MQKGLTLFVLLGLSNLFFMVSASACDDKSCETAYLAEVDQHVKNYARRGYGSMHERHAHAKNRERKAYALYVHYFLMKYGDPTDKKSKYYHENGKADINVTSISEPYPEG